MKYIQERLGHGSIQITSDVYSHISSKLESKNTSQSNGKESKQKVEYMDSADNDTIIFY